jgi:hypothetical protein
MPETTRPDVPPPAADLPPPPHTVGRMADLLVRLQRDPAGWAVLLLQGVYKREHYTDRVLPIAEDVRPRLAPDSWVTLYQGPDADHALRLQRHVASVLRHVIREAIYRTRHGRIAEDWDPKLAANIKAMLVKDPPPAPPASHAPDAGDGSRP